MRIAAANESTLFTREFSLADRVAFVSGARRGIGLEAAFTLAEAGARAVYCVDLVQDPGEEWTKVREFATRMGLGSFHYVQGDVRDQVRKTSSRNTASMLRYRVSGTNVEVGRDGRR